METEVSGDEEMRDGGVQTIKGTRKRCSKRKPASIIESDQELIHCTGRGCVIKRHLGRVGRFEASRIDR
jgi:hypothetical protein